MNTTNRGWITGGAVALLLLAGCGGHDRNDQVSMTPSTPSTPTTPSNEVPTSISASVGAFIAYLQTLAGANADTSEPLVVSSAVTAPTDETTEPTKVD